MVYRTHLPKPAAMHITATSAYNWRERKKEEKKKEVGIDEERRANGGGSGTKPEREYRGRRLREGQKLRA